MPARLPNEHGNRAEPDRSAAATHQDRRRGDDRLEHVEAVVALTAGGAASSAALIGFGLDSVVEVPSAAAVAWQFATPDPQRREKTALRVIAVSFFSLAAYVTVDAVLSLMGLYEPGNSPVGIAIAALSLVVMPFLSWFERRTGRELGPTSAVADSKQTLICAYLSVALLVGLVLNSVFGRAWADSVAALVIAVFALREGVQSCRGDACCASPTAVLTGEQESHPCEGDCVRPSSIYRRRRQDHRKRVCLQHCAGAGVSVTFRPNQKCPDDCRPFSVHWAVWHPTPQP